MGLQRKTQEGVSLIMVILILATLTLLGIASLRGTNVYQRMAAGNYDRNLTFQQAESGMVKAQAAVRQLARSKEGNEIGEDCTVIFCPVVPVSTYQGMATSCTGTSCWKTLQGVDQTLVDEAPQYYVQYLGQRGTQPLKSDEVEDAYGFPMDNEGGLQYVFRITLRSADPDKTATAGRAFVVLQSLMTTGG